MDPSISVRPVRRGVCQLVAGLSLLMSAALTSAQPSPVVNIVSGDGCPLRLERVALSAAPTGVSITYSIRNDERDAVREVVMTAAALNAQGEVVTLRMQPVVKRIPAHSSNQSTIVFPDLDLKDAEFVSVGVQGVRWTSRRTEWRAALRVNPSSVTTAKN